MTLRSHGRRFASCLTRLVVADDQELRRCRESARPGDEVPPTWKRLRHRQFSALPSCKDIRVLAHGAVVAAGADRGGPVQGKMGSCRRQRPVATRGGSQILFAICVL